MRDFKFHRFGGAGGCSGGGTDCTRRIYDTSETCVQDFIVLLSLLGLLAKIKVSYRSYRINLR